MARPWQTVDRVRTGDGTLELRRRGDSDFLITVDGRVLMNSASHRSELALGVLACAHLRGRRTPRVLVGGLGMGFTLRAALDFLSPGARVVVAELVPRLVQWCRGPLADLTGRVLEDPRVSVEVADVAAVIGRAGARPSGRFDAIVLDLYEGPHAGHHRENDPLYGSRALASTRAALAPRGVLAVWGEGHDPGFAKRLGRAGFSVSCRRPGRGGLRHQVYLAVKDARPGRAGRGGPR